MAVFSGSTNHAFARLNEDGSLADNTLEEVNDSTRTGLAFIEDSLSTFKGNIDAKNPNAFLALQIQLSVLVGRELREKRELELRVHFLEGEKKELMERLSVSKREFDIVKADIDTEKIKTKKLEVDLEAEKIKTALLQVDFNKEKTKTTKLEDTVSILALRLDDLVAMFKKQQEGAAHGEEFASYSKNLATGVKPNKKDE